MRTFSLGFVWSVVLFSMACSDGGTSGGVGGARPTGGITGTGGQLGTGGQASGGREETGGLPGSGGRATRAGGRTGTGGQLGSGGHLGTGGRTGTGGQVGSGGRTGTGGAMATAGTTGSDCASGASVTFVHIGDPQDQPDNFQTVIAAAAAHKPDLLISTGDLADGFDEDEDPSGDRSLTAWKQIVKSNPVTAPLLSRGCVRVALGNHDCTESSRDGEDPEATPAFLDPEILQDGKQSYHYTAGSCFLVSLKYENLRERNVAFLESALATDAAKRASWRIVYGHWPIYNAAPDHFTDGNTNGYDDDVAAVRKVFDRYGVHLYISGHQHSYERSHVIKNGEVVTTEKKSLDATSQPGTIYLIGGKSGGTNYTDMTKQIAKYEWVNTYRYLTEEEATYNVITATASTLELTARYVDRSEIIDQFVIQQ